jgi:hypothetical protein
MLKGVHKTQRMASALTCLERYHKDGDRFLNHIVRITDDETRALFVNVETKEQSKQSMNTFIKQAENVNKRRVPEG